MADRERGPYSPLLLLDVELKSPVYNAGDFTARDAGDVLVPGGWLPVPSDVATYAYIMLGRMMTVFLALTTSPVASAPMTLCIAIPEGKVCAARCGTLLFLVDQAARTPAWVDVRAGESFIRIIRLDGVAMANGPSNTIHGQVTFPVN